MWWEEVGVLAQAAEATRPCPCPRPRLNLPSPWALSILTHALSKPTLDLSRPSHRSGLCHSPLSRALPRTRPSQAPNPHTLPSLLSLDSPKHMPRLSHPTYLRNHRHPCPRSSSTLSPTYRPFLTPSSSPSGRHNQDLHLLLLWSSFSPWMPSSQPPCTSPARIRSSSAGSSN